MNHPKQQLSPLQLIESRPTRKSRSESLLRLLISTSYPHGYLSNLVMDMVKGYQMLTHEELEDLAAELRDRERAMGIFDFIRCIEIKRQGTQLSVTGKTLKIEGELKAIRDTVKHHEPSLPSDIVLPEADLPLSSASALARSLAEGFYRTQVGGTQKQTDLRGSEWICRHMGPAPTEAGQKRIYRDEAVTFEVAVEIIQRSLEKPEHHLILTQNTILLMDQSVRLWNPEVR